MHTFKIKTNGFDEIRRRVIITTLILMVFVLSAVFLLPSMLAGQAVQFNESSWMSMLFIAAIMVFTTFISLKKQKNQFESFVLVIDETSITRKIPKMPDITIKKKDVTSIIKSVNGSFAIQSSSKLNAIGVPAQIESPEILEVLLAEITPLKVRTSRTWLEKWGIFIGGSGALSFVVALSTPNRWLSIIAGALCIAVIGISFVIIQRSKNVDYRTKKISLFIIIPLAVILIMTIKKLLL